jgi:uncharacterized protein YecT (DUF1311 family)
MMRPLHLSIILAMTTLQLAACGEDHAVQDESAATISRDSSLAHDLQLATGDTAPFTEAADVAVADRGGGIPPMVESRGAHDAQPASNAGGATVTESPGSVAPTSGAPTAGSAPSVAGASAESYIGPSCASPALPDQRRCLLAYLARSDVNLDRTYQSLIARLESEAPTQTPGEPVTVQRLRTAQRQWLVYRDDECRRRNEGKEGPLWAPTRAQCLAEYSEQRTKELANALATRQTTPLPATKTSAPPKPNKSKSTTHKHTRAKRHRR